MINFINLLNIYANFLVIIIKYVKDSRYGVYTNSGNKVKKQVLPFFLICADLWLMVKNTGT